MRERESECKFLFDILLIIQKLRVYKKKTTKNFIQLFGPKFNEAKLAPLNAFPIKKKTTTTTTGPRQMKRETVCTKLYYCHKENKQQKNENKNEKRIFLQTRFVSALMIIFFLVLPTDRLNVYFTLFLVVRLLFLLLQGASQMSLRRSNNKVNN